MGAVWFHWGEKKMKSFSVKPGARLNLPSEAPQCLDSGHELQKEETKKSTYLASSGDYWEVTLSVL